MAQFAYIKSPVYPALARIFVADTAYISIIEDIQTSFGRIFIDKQGYDINTLAHLNGKQWHYNNKDLFSSYLAPVGGNQSVGTMILTGGSVTTSSPVEGAIGGTESSTGLRWLYNNYHLYLDPSYPVKPFIKLASNNSFYGVGSTPNATLASATPNYGLLYGPDITNGAIAGNTFGPTSSAFASIGNQILYEDATNGNLWTICTIGGTNTVVFSTNNYQGNATPTVTTVSNLSGFDQYYMGNDSNNNPYFVGVNHTVANEPISVLLANATSKALIANAITANVPATSNAQLYNMAIPSNLRTDSSTRKVFYTMHWDSSNNLAPVQYIWNPALVGNVSKVNCTLSYPGANTYANYAAHYANTGALTTLNMLYAARPYQFTVGSTNYITFTTFDIGAGYVANSATRFANTLSRAWVTYSLGSVATSNDNVLTFHSSITANTIQEFPHNWMPVPGTSGNTLAVATHNEIRFLQFNTTSGWQITSTYKGRSTGFGFDQTNRMWAIMADTPNTAAGSVHIITPTSNSAVPTSVSVVYANSNLTYAGANVSTTAALNTYDQYNARMVANVTLTIDGGSMTFSDGSKSKSYATSNSADTTVNLTIISGGTSTIIPSVNI